MHNVRMHDFAISKLLYGFASVLAIIHSVKLMAYLPVQSHKPYNNFCLTDEDFIIILVIGKQN